MLSTPAKLIQSFLPAVVAIVVALQIMNSPEKNWAGTRRKVFKATLVEEEVVAAMITRKLWVFA